MKQVPLNQPHATLVSLGIQTVVTSSHRIEPGTRIAVKANKRKPSVEFMANWVPIGDQELWERLHPITNGDDEWFGVVVCTAAVTDCLPINSTSWGQATSYIQTSPSRVNDLILRWDLTDGIRREWHSTDISDQLPYCDWTKRWAWLLADIEHDIECPDCHNRGTVYDGLPCLRCGGSGVVRLDSSSPTRVALPPDPKDMP